MNCMGILEIENKELSERIKKLEKEVKGLKEENEELISAIGEIGR